MQDATTIRPTGPDTPVIAPAIDPERIEPGWTPPAERLVLGWAEVAAGWLAVCGLIAVVGAAWSMLDQRPAGEPILLSAEPPSVELIAAKGGEICPFQRPAQTFAAAAQRPA